MAPDRPNSVSPTPGPPTDRNYFIGVATYFRGWDRLVRRELIALTAVVAFPVAIFAGVSIAALAGDEKPILVCFGAWAVVAGVCLFRSYRTPCPACGRAFYMPAPVASNPFARKCPHCGVAKFSPCAGCKSPGNTILAYVRFRRRAARGRCGYCGYDVRSATDRCPECGERMPEKAQAFVPRP